MKRFLKFSALALLSCSFLTPAAYAQELDENGQKLKAMFEDMIEATSEASVNNLSALEFDGDVSVEQAGSYYAVTLPYATLNYNDGAKFEIGLIAINAAAHKNPDEWKMTFALPTPMTFIDEEGNKDFQIHIGGQRAAGVWNNTLGYFSKLDAQYQDIQMKDHENSFIFTMPQVKAVYDLNADENQRWSGPVYFTFNDMNLNIPEQGGEVLRIGDMNLNMEMFDYNPAGFIDYQQRIEQLILQSENPETQQNPPDISGLLDAFIEMVGNGFTSEYQINNLVVSGGKSKEKFETLNIDSAGFGIDLTGFLNNDVTIELRMGYDGFQITPTPEDMPDLAPETLNFDVSLQNIPFREIADMGKNTAEMALANPQMAQMAGMSVLFKLPALLSQAGTSLVIENNHFGNDMYHANIDGKIVTDLQAANSATADITARLRGLDAVIQSLNAQMIQNPDDGNQSFIQQMLMGLTMAKGFATVENDENGRPVHVYKFIMNPQGKMLLNDQDMSALTGGMMGAPLGGQMGGMPPSAPGAPAE